MNNISSKLVDTKLAFDLVIFLELKKYVISTYDVIFAQNDVILGENRQNDVILGQNDVISQNLGKVVKKFFLQKFGKIFPGGSPWKNLTKKVIKGVNLAKIGHFW